MGREVVTYNIVLVDRVCVDNGYGIECTWVVSHFAVKPSPLTHRKIQSFRHGACRLQFWVAGEITANPDVVFLRAYIANDPHPVLVRFRNEER